MKQTEKSKAAIIASDLRKQKLDVALLGASNSPAVVTEWLSTGCMPLDQIMGGGLPVGRIVEVYGDTSTGKSLIAAQVIAMAQQEGHIGMMFDTESAVSLPIMAAVGVNVDDLIYSAPDTIEGVFEQMEGAIVSKAERYPDELLVIVWDSVAGTSSEAEMSKDYGDVGYLTHARVISQSMRKISRLISQSRVCALFLNQVRENIGVMFGDKETTFGGKAIPFHASIRVRLKLGKKILHDKKVVGLNTTASVVKNKVAMPFLSATLPIYFGHGIDDPSATLFWLQDNGIVGKSQYMTIELGGKEIKFQKQGWRKVYENNYDEIYGIVMEGLGEGFVEQYADEAEEEE